MGIKIVLNSLMTEPRYLIHTKHSASATSTVDVDSGDCLDGGTEDTEAHALPTVLHCHACPEFFIS